MSALMENGRWIALKPLTATAPDGSLVNYEPGDVVPAEDWGRALDHLKEADKIAYVYAPSDAWILKECEQRGLVHGELPPPAHPKTVEEVIASGAGFPEHLGFGQFLLSDGSRVKGKQKAIDAQAAIDLTAPPE